MLNDDRLQDCINANKASVFKSRVQLPIEYKELTIIRNLLSRLSKLVANTISNDDEIVNTHIQQWGGGVRGI